MARKLQFVEPVKEDFLCCVCHEPWNVDEASLCTSCQGILCGRCYDEKTAKGTACLHCKVDPATFVAPHRLVRGLAESLQVRCHQHGFGCTWTGPRSELPNHDAVCTFKPKPFAYVDESKIPGDLICPLCHMPLFKPVQLPCEHVFCHQCIVDSLSRRGECPVDRSAADLGAISDAPKVVREMTDDLLVYCVNRGLTTNPCTWQGRRRDYEGHRTTCTAAAAATAAVPPVTTAVPVPPVAAVPIPTVPAAAPTRMGVTIHSEYPTFVAGNPSEEFCVMAHVAAPTMTRLEDRKKPLSISAVIDVSGSMSGAKMQTMISALHFMVDELTDRDEFGIVAFSSGVTNALPLQRMDGEGKRDARSVISALRAGGSTNLSGGLMGGIEMVKRTLAAPMLKRRPGVRFAADASALGATVSVSAWFAVMRRDGKQVYKYGLSAKLDATAMGYVHSMTVGPGSRALGLRGDELTWEEHTHISVLTVSVTTSFGNAVIEVPLSPDTVTTKVASIITGAAPGPATASDIAFCRAVMLFTDGQANIGLSDAASFAGPMRTALLRNEDIVVHTFGFGADHNASLLRAIAENASGTYYYIKSVDSLKESFADCLGGLMSTVAQGVKLTFATTSNFQVVRTLSSYPTTTINDGSVTVTLRDLYSGEGRDVLFLVKPRTALALSGTAVPIAAATVVYDSLLTGAADTVSSEIQLLAAASKFEGPANVQVVEQRARLEATEAMAAVRAKADRGDVEEARKDMLNWRRKVAEAPKTAVTNQLCDDMDEIGGMLENTEKWNAEGTKLTAQYCAGHAQQRMNRAPSAMTEGLAQMDNMFKAAMRSKAKK